MELKKVLMGIVINVPPLYNLQVYSFYRRQFKRYLQMHHIPNVPQKGEKEYLSKWGGLFMQKLSLIRTACSRGIRIVPILSQRTLAGAFWKLS